MSNYNKKELVGVRVAHDFNDFVEEREVILTLQDTYVLEGQDVNRSGDVLENVDMAGHFKTEAIQQSRMKKDDYLEGKYGGEKKLLPQYDEVKTQKEGITLDSYGEFNLERQKKIESIKNKLAGPNKKGNEVSLETTKNVASEYFTSDEMKKFKKPIKKAVNVKKDKEDILKLLEDALGDDAEGHHGSRDIRRARERDTLEDITTKKVKTDNYEIALQKAREQTKYSSMVDEEYEGIQRAIENQRRAAQNKVNKVEDVVRTLIETNQTANGTHDPNKDVVVLSNIKKKPADAEFVEIELDTINTSTDFLKTVATREEMNEQKMKITEPLSFSMKDTKNGTASVVNVSLPSEKLLAWKKAQSGLESIKPIKKEAAPENGEKPAEESDDLYPAEDLDKLIEERNFIEEEDFSKGGMLAALKAAREKGYLFENEVEVAGRSKDRTYREELSKFGGDKESDIRLEYRDSRGRIMTPKEAFRYQCRIFHGINPSKNKQEKEKRKYEASRKLLQTAPQDVASMKALAKLQQQNHTPYVVLNTKNQPNK